jgi:hypothetical protein
MTIDNNLDNQNLDNQNPNNQNNQNPPKTFTQAEVDEMLQREADRRVSSARAKFEEEYRLKLEKEKSEAEKLAQLSESEKAKMEIQRQKDEFENERKQFLREKLELQTVKELASIGLPTEFSRFIVHENSNADEIKKSIEVLKTEFEKAIEEAVNKKLQGTTPKVTTKKDGTTVTKEQFRKMGYEERMKIFESDEALYQELSS